MALIKSAPGIKNAAVKSLPPMALLMVKMMAAPATNTPAHANK